MASSKGAGGGDMEPSQSAEQVARAALHASRLWPVPAPGISGCTRCRERHGGRSLDENRRLGRGRCRSVQIGGGDGTPLAGRPLGSAQSHLEPRHRDGDTKP